MNVFLGNRWKKTSGKLKKTENFYVVMNAPKQLIAKLDAEL